MANEVQAFDGFRYEFEEGQLWNSDRGEGTDIVVLKLIDDARGVEAHAYFRRDQWDEFRRTINIGALLPSPDELRRVGI